MRALSHFACGRQGYIYLIEITGGRNFGERQGLFHCMNFLISPASWPPRLRLDFYLVCKQGGAGSSPATSTKMPISTKYGPDFPGKTPTSKAGVPFP